MSAIKANKKRIGRTKRSIGRTMRKSARRYRARKLEEKSFDLSGFEVTVNGGAVAGFKPGDTVTIGAGIRGVDYETLVIEEVSVVSEVDWSELLRWTASPTVRPCRICGVEVEGGPTLCEDCARRPLRGLVLAEKRIGRPQLPDVYVPPFVPLELPT